MSLIIGVSYRDQFVMASNDSMVTVQTHNTDTFEREEKDVSKVDRKSEKVKRLSNNVLLCVSGIEDICKLVEKELVKRIHANDDLYQCADVLEEVITKLNSKEVNLMNGLLNREVLSIKFLNTKFFSCYMLGFNQNGNSGVVRYNPLEMKVERMESPLNGGYPVIINGPSEDDIQFQKYLDLPDEYQDIQTFIGQFVFIHANLSHIHSQSVSTDCKFHILYKGSRMKYLQQTVETSDFYEKFGLT